MFAAIARKYDLNNRLHSLWQDQLWRRFAVRFADLKPGDRVLDVACGTGDLSMAFARAAGKGGGGVTGLDITDEMLDVARHKLHRLPPPLAEKISYAQGDAQHLPFADGSFDVVSIAFGIRNVQDPAKALAEFRRVLSPNGRLIILEFAEPRNPLVRAFNNLYSKRIMPITATLIAHDRSGAYKYLPRSVSTFMAPGQMRSALEAAGFTGVETRPLSMGICMCYRADAR